MQLMAVIAQTGEGFFLLSRNVFLPSATEHVMVSSFLTSLPHPPPQDHLFLPASPLLLQRLTARLCPPSEAAVAAAPYHLGHPSAGDLPEAAVGEPAAARVPGQPVSEHTCRKPEDSGVCRQ